MVRNTDRYTIAVDQSRIPGGTHATADDDEAKVVTTKDRSEKRKGFQREDHITQVC